MEMHCLAEWVHHEGKMILYCSYNDVGEMVFHMCSDRDFEMGCWTSLHIRSHVIHSMVLLGSPLRLFLDMVDAMSEVAPSDLLLGSPCQGS